MEQIKQVFNIKDSSAIKKITFYEKENLKEAYVVVNFKGTNEDYIYNITKRLSSVLKQTLQYAITNNLSIGSWYNFNLKECEEISKEEFENKIQKY